LRQVIVHAAAPLLRHAKIQELHHAIVRRRLGAISKQGNTMVRWLLIEAVYPAVRKDPELRQDYQRLKFRRGHAVAKVAIARKLAVRMYWMLRSGAAYAQLVRRQGSPGGTLVDASSSLF
jgi:transposase